MKQKKGKNFIDLQQLAGGTFADKMNEALLQVAANIQNPNTDATTKRGITINIKFAPDKSRQFVNTTIAVTTKLAPTEAIDTQIVMGLNPYTGELEIAEYGAQMWGQMNVADYDPETGEIRENNSEDAG